MRLIMMSQKMNQILDKWLRAQGSERRAQGSGRRAQGTGLRAQGAGHRARSSELERIDRCKDKPYVSNGGCILRNTMVVI
jgi:hypothetical protein